MDPGTGIRDRGSRLFSILGIFALMWLWLVLLVVLSALGGTGQIAAGIIHHPFLGISSNLLLARLGVDPSHLSGSQIGTVFLVTCVLAPLFEETVFRGLVCHKWAGDGRGNLVNWWPVLAISSILFGFLHTLNYNGVMLQGVIGFLLAMLWFRNGPTQWKSYFSCVLAHGLYNLSVLCMTIMMNRAVIQALQELAKKLAGAH